MISFFQTTSASYNLTFHIFTQEHECRKQTIRIVSAASRAIAALAYGHFFNNRNLIPLFLFTAIASSLVQLLRLPLTTIEPLESIDLAFWYSIIVSVIESGTIQVAFLPRDELATNLASEQSGCRDISYGILLAALDLGDTAGGWITAYVTRKLDITFSDFGNLPTLYTISGIAKPAAILIGIPLLMISRSARRHLQS